MKANQPNNFDKTLLEPAAACELETKARRRGREVARWSEKGKKGESLGLARSSSGRVDVRRLYCMANRDGSCDLAASK